jgi:uncharacterized protein involved in exopolysaccharide biosynthesis
MTRNLPREYQSDTEIFTGIASGPTIASVESSALDFFATNNDYDNLINVIKSKQTLVEVGERLLIQHMMLDSANPRFISEENYGHFRYKIPQELEDSLLVPGDEEQTLLNIRKYRLENYDSYLVKLTFEDAGSPYSYKAIQKINVYRLQNSDLINISYTWADAGITQHTLDILNNVFTQKLSQIKQGQSSDVIKYFENEVENAVERLKQVEIKLKNFRINNRIINYEEQTKSIATLKEMMETEYQQELAMKAAAEASVLKLEEQLELNKEIMKFSDLILQKREKLAEINSQIVQLEVYYEDDKMMRDLKKEAKKIKAQLSNVLEKRYQHSRTTEGVPIEESLQQWLTYTLALDESKARLDVFESRKSYFRDIYDEFSPLGSELARMEREIAVEERNYLELLHGLNMAKMRQQSEALATGGLVVTVQPNFPLQPKKSKAMLLVFVAAVIGFIMPFSIVIVMEFLDNTVRNPERAEELTNLKLLGAFPDLTKRSENRNIDMDWLRDKSLGLLSQNTRLEMRNLGIADQKPKHVVVYSTRQRDGKAYMTHLLANELVSLNFKVMVIYHKLNEDYEAFYDVAQYENNKKFLKTQNFEDLMPVGFDSSLYDFIFVTFESILTEQYSLDLNEKADMAFCVLSANRSWNKADKFAMKEFINTLNVQPRLIVNGVEPDYMDAVLGDIKKSRSSIRKYLKMLFTLQFHSKKFKAQQRDD